MIFCVQVKIIGQKNLIKFTGVKIVICDIWKNLITHYKITKYFENCMMAQILSKYNSFNKNREKYKLDKIKKIINFKNKEILESNCGAATNLDFLKKKLNKHMV